MASEVSPPVHGPLATFQTNVLTPIARLETAVLYKLILAIVAVPVVIDHVPVPSNPGLFAAITKLVLVEQSCMSGPALALAGAFPVYLVT